MSITIKKLISYSNPEYNKLPTTSFLTKELSESESQLILPSFRLKKLASELQKQATEHPLLIRYINLLKSLAGRVEIQLPTSLKRQKTLEPFKDQQQFGGLQKKVKGE